MLILKNSKDLLPNLISRRFSEISSLQTFEFSILYHLFVSLLRVRKNMLFLVTNPHIFLKHCRRAKRATQKSRFAICLIISLITYLSYLGGAIFNQQVGIPIDTNCAPLLADLFLYSYQTEFLQILKKNKTYKMLNLLTLHKGISMMFRSEKQYYSHFRHVDFTQSN